MVLTDVKGTTLFGIYSKYESTVNHAVGLHIIYFCVQREKIGLEYIKYFKLV